MDERGSEGNKLRGDGVEKRLKIAEMPIKVVGLTGFFTLFTFGLSVLNKGKEKVPKLFYEVLCEVSERAFFASVFR